MPSLDIIAAIKLIIGLFKRFNRKLRVLKLIDTSDNNAPVLCLQNVGSNSVYILDFGFVGKGCRASVTLPYVQINKPRIEFPQSLDPRASLRFVIGLGAVDHWQGNDFYVTLDGGRTIFIKCDNDPTTAR